jgi:putative DNA primase/helicase
MHTNTKSNNQTTNEYGDVRNARRFVKLNKGKVIYIPQSNSWCHFKDNKQKWVKDNMNFIMQSAIKVTDNMIFEASNKSIEVSEKYEDRKYLMYESSQLLKYAQSAQMKSRLDAMIALASSDTDIAVSQEIIDNNDMLLGCENGIIDLDTCKVRNGKPEDYITLSSNVAYDNTAKCTKWEKYLEEMQPDADVRKWIQKYIGYCMTGATNEQIFTIMCGDGSNGKSVFTNTIKTLFGNYSATTSFETFAEHSTEAIRNDLARLNKIRLVVASESNETVKLDEGLMKLITGGEKIESRFLHKEFFEYQPKFKIILVTNNLPKITGKDYGIWRRIVLIPWAIKVSDATRDFGLEEKLKSEMPGILNWSLMGLKLFKKEGLKLPVALEKARSVFKSQSDDLTDWFAEFLMLDKYAKTSVFSLVESYNVWAKKMGRSILSDKKLSQQLNEMQELTSCKIYPSNRAAFSGVRFIEHAEP